MSWGEVTLAPGETYTMRYDVGIKPMATLEMTKKAENKTSNDGKTRVGDKIEYTVTLAAPKGSYSNVKFEDVLPKGFEQPKPDDIVTVNPADGSAAESILMKDAYVTDVPVGKEGIGTVKLPVAGNGYTIPKDKTVTIKFTLTVAKEAAGKEIKNVATVSGKTEEDTTFTDDVEDENPFTVENSQPVIVKHVDEKGVPLPGIPDKPYEGDIGATITIDPENDHKLNGYMYVKASKSLTVTFSELEQEILLYYKENRFTIKQEVSKTNGSDAHNAAVDMGELLKYTTTVTSQLKPDTTPGADIVYYDNFAVVANVSEHLKDVSKFKLVSTKGVELPSIDYKYDPIANTISVTLLRAHGITSDEHLVLTYEGTVKDISDVDIKAKATASGNYSDGMVATAITSNEVISKRGAGNLEFTAPTNWDFGERAISDKEQEYSLAKLDEHILVTDNRAVGSKWKLDATLTSNFTLAGSGIEMPNVLKYKKGTNLSSLELNTPKEIVSAETTAGTRGKAVNVTENWVANKEGLVLVVPGSIVKKGTYEAAITWTVTDAP